MGQTREKQLSVGGQLFLDSKFTGCYTTGET